MKKIIPYGRHKIDNDEIEVLKNFLLKDKQITQGPEVELFGQSVAKYVGAKYGVALSSGTAALHAATAAIGLKKGDEVITTPITFCATANAVLYTGADIKLVDIDSDTLNIDENLIEKNITNKTKAIMPVDFRGHPASLFKINQIAKKYKLKVIEDASHSLGSIYKHKKKFLKCGSCDHVDLATFSFHPVKHITTGEGGVVTTNNYNFYKKMIDFRKHGIDRNKSMISKKKRIGEWIYDMNFLGYNYRLTDIQSVLGLQQLKKINQFIKRRRQIVKYYNDYLKNIDLVITPFEDKNVNSNFHIYVLQIKNYKSINRYNFYKYLVEKNYAPMVHYIPLHYLKFYKKKYNFKKNQFPNSEKYYKQALSVPLYPSLTDHQIEKTARDIKFFFK